MILKLQKIFPQGLTPSKHDRAKVLNFPKEGKDKPEITGREPLESPDFKIGTGMSGIVGLIGRDKELHDLAILLNQKQSVLIWGKRSIGKTALLEQLAYEQNRDNLIFIRQTKPLAVMFENFFEILWQKDLIHTSKYDQYKYCDHQGRPDFEKLWKSLKRDNAAVKALVLEEIFSAHQGFIFLIDDIHEFPITASRMLTHFITYGTLICTAFKKSKSMDAIYYQFFQKYPLGTLDDGFIKLIAQRFIRSESLPVQDEEHFLNYFVRGANGNPGAAANMLISVKNTPSITSEIVRGFINSGGTKDINIGVVWVLLGLTLGAFRIYGQRTGNLTLAVAGVLVISIIFIFRGFFMEGLKNKE